MNRLARSLATLALLAGPVVASDWYVDANNGSNSNTGTSPSDAWRSITWAVANTPATGVQRIHIAAGAYGHTTGEQFPIALRPDLQLIGDPGSSRPLIGRVGAFSTLELITTSGMSIPPSAETVVENVALARGGLGLRISLSSGAVRVTVRDVLFDGTASSGVSTNVYPGAALELSLERVRYLGPLVIPEGTGLFVRGDSAIPTLVDARDCEFLGGRTAARLEGNIDARFERSRFEGSLFENVSVAKLNGDTRVVFESCCLSDSNNYGCKMARSNTAGVYTARFLRCTIADNGLTGIRVWGSGSIAPSIEVEQCILANDGSDLGIPATSVVRESLVKDGQFTGVNGNFTATPMFVAVQAGDWSLRWGSPCIDRIADPAVATQLDLTRRARGVDGDLDRSESSDIGAFEFRPLGAARTVRLGSTLALDCWGPQGSASQIWGARSAPVAPVATPFGEFDLPPGLAQLFATTTTGALAPTQVLRHVPNNPLLAGQTYSFQALVDSPASPSGKAYSNVAAITFVP